VIDQVETQVVARYGPSNGWLDGQVAVTVHPYGRGFVYLIGAYLDDGSQQALLDHIVTLAGIRPALETPDGVEAHKRVNAQGQEIWIVINHEREEKRVHLAWPAQEHLTGQGVNGDLCLGPYGVAVLTRSS